MPITTTQDSPDTQDSRPANRATDIDRHVGSRIRERRIEAERRIEEE